MMTNFWIPLWKEKVDDENCILTTEYCMLTFALTFSNEAGLISEKHIKKTS